MQRKVEWTKIETGLYRNHESGVEIEKIGGRWETSRPLSVARSGSLREYQRAQGRLKDAQKMAERMYILAVHRPMVEAAEELAWQDEATRAASDARSSGVTLDQVQTVLDKHPSHGSWSLTIGQLRTLTAIARSDAETQRAMETPGAADRLVAAIMDGPAAEDDETEEILRDVIVAQVMEWVARGSDPTDLDGILKAAGDYRAWESTARPVQD